MPTPTRNTLWRMLRRDPSAVSAFLEKLGLNVRARTVLQQAGVASREDILAIGYEHFRRQKNCGAKSLKEIGLAIGGWPSCARPCISSARPAPVASMPFGSRFAITSSSTT